MPDTQICLKCNKARPLGTFCYCTNPDRPPSDPGYRLNAGKDRYDLLPAKALYELGRVYSFGAGKYSDRNWEKGLDYMATVASLLRHVFAFVRGQDNDPESGLHHMAHAAFNCLALVEFHYTGKGKDDRPYKVAAPPDIYGGCS